MIYGGQGVDGHTPACEAGITGSLPVVHPISGQNMNKEMLNFAGGLHKSTKLLAVGKAFTVDFPDNVVDAILTQNLYGQRIVWGKFSVDHRKNKSMFKGRLANNANTEGVVFVEDNSVWVRGYKRICIWLNRVRRFGL